MATNPAQPSSVLDRLRDQHRPVIVFGPSADDPRVVRQGHAWVGPLPEAGIKDRDIAVVNVHGEAGGDVAGKPIGAAEVAQLRSAFGVEPGEFAVVLVGRDGGEKDRWAEPVSAQEIFGHVDAMPMRQREVEDRGGGSK